jgi:hypothetical protein
MDKLTVTEAGRVELGLVSLSLDKENTSRFPLIYRPPLNPNQTTTLQSKSQNKKTLNRFNVQSLRSLLKDDTLAEINRVREQTEQRAYRFVK